MTTRPVVHVDRPLLDEDAEYVGERASLVGPGDDSLAGADATVVGIGHHWDAARFARFPNLKVVSRMGIGYDNIDVPAARAAGVVVCNAPDAPTISTAEHAVALMLAVAKELPRQQVRAAAGHGVPVTPTALELDGAVLGLVGIGRIGARVASVALALGMRVRAHDPFVAESPVGGVELCDLERIWRESDVISLHAPALESTYHIVNAESLAAVRPGALIINCARGSLIDHDALLAALDSGHLGGAGLDVTEPEPLPMNHPLLSRANVIVTPHVASSTTVGRRRLFEHAVDNALAVLAGRPASVVS